VTGQGDGSGSRTEPPIERDQTADRAARAALLHELLGDGGRLVVVSNRGPLTFEEHGATPGGLRAERGSGGLVTALAELGRHAPVTWVAVAMTAGDRIAADALESGDQPRRSAVLSLIRESLPDQDITLRYQSLETRVFERYYGVVANPFLWFVQHQMYASAYGPNVDDTLLDAWRHGYRPANEALANAAADAAGEATRATEARGNPRPPIVLLQDYHLYVAATRLRQLRPDATILHFTHIPWPPVDQWRLLPQGMRRALCEGLLACDIVGMQTDRYAANFVDTVASFVRDARVDRAGRTVAWRGRRIRVRAYPISVDPDGLGAFARSAAVTERVTALRARVRGAGSPRLIVRADRLEPSKNALRGFLAYEALLAQRPELRREVRFIAVQSTSREHVPEYAAYAAAVHGVIERINANAAADEQPVWVLDGSDYAMAIAAMRVADVVLVNPVYDGMNLVAKEAVLVGERDPVLVLSETAGAAEQLATDALTIAPADVIGTADALERALDMPVGERRTRLRHMRGSVRQEDLDWWLTRQLRDLAAVRRGALPPSRRLRDNIRKVEGIEV
jgi:trehalose 6-phosphate synthase